MLVKFIGDAVAEDVAVVEYVAVVADGSWRG